MNGDHPSAGKPRGNLQPSRSVLPVCWSRIVLLDEPVLSLCQSWASYAAEHVLRFGSREEQVAKPKACDRIVFSYAASFSPGAVRRHRLPLDGAVR